MLLAEKITLPCGLVLPNRLSKAAMAESLAEKTNNPEDTNNPNEKLEIAYREWATGGWGMILTGNVQVSELYLGQPNDVQSYSEPSPALKQQWKEWASSVQSEGTPGIVQICHPGRQSPLGAGGRGFFAKTMAPSPVPLDFGPSLISKGVVQLMFGTPREMTEEDIQTVIKQFVAASKQAFEAGFKGVQLHAAHGYLLSQFLSPKTNLRTDAWGGSPAKSAALTIAVINAVRAATSPSFCIGIKLNSADVGSSYSLSDVLTQIRLIVDAGIDFLEVSGGSYEDPTMGGQDEVKKQDDAAGVPNKSKKTAEREAFFLAFSATVREHFPDLVLMVTGGFRTRVGMEAAIASKACDIIGLARPASVLPKLPKEIILNESVSDEEASVKLKRVDLPVWITWLPFAKSVGAGFVSKHYETQIKRMADGLAPIDCRA